MTAETAKGRDGDGRVLWSAAYLRAFLIRYEAIADVLRESGNTSPVIKNIVSVLPTSDDEAILIVELSPSPGSHIIERFEVRVRRTP